MEDLFLVKFSPARTSACRRSDPSIKTKWCPVTPLNSCHWLWRLPTSICGKVCTLQEKISLISNGNGKEYNDWQAEHDSVTHHNIPKKKELIKSTNLIPLSPAPPRYARISYYLLFQPEKNWFWHTIMYKLICLNSRSSTVPHRSCSRIIASAAT